MKKSNNFVIILLAILIGLLLLLSAGCSTGGSLAKDTNKYRFRRQLDYNSVIAHSLDSRIIPVYTIRPIKRK